MSQNGFIWFTRASMSQGVPVSTQGEEMNATCRQLDDPQKPSDCQQKTHGSLKITPCRLKCKNWCSEVAFLITASCGKQSTYLTDLIWPNIHNYTSSYIFHICAIVYKENAPTWPPTKHRGYVPLEKKKSPSIHQGYHATGRASIHLCQKIKGHVIFHLRHHWRGVFEFHLLRTTLEMSFFFKIALLVLKEKMRKKPSVWREFWSIFVGWCLDNVSKKVNLNKNMSYLYQFHLT